MASCVVSQPSMSHAFGSHSSLSARQHPDICPLTEKNASKWHSRLTRFIGIGQFIGKLTILKLWLRKRSAVLIYYKRRIRFQVSDSNINSGIQEESIIKCKKKKTNRLIPFSPEHLRHLQEGRHDVLDAFTKKPHPSDGSRCRRLTVS